MVSEGGRGSLLDACYQSKEIPYYPALLIRGQIFLLCLQTLGQITFAHDFPVRTDFPTAASLRTVVLYFVNLAQLNAWLCLTQTVDHVVLQCPIHRPPHGLTVVDDETIEWLFNTCPKI